MQQTDNRYRVSNTDDSADFAEEEEKINQPQILIRPTWLIAEGETLVSIAENLYSDPHIAWLIANLNNGNAEEYFIDGKRIVEFNSRQQITLPVWQDVVDFYDSVSSPADPENLITIVKSTKLDREVVDSALNKVMSTSLPAQQTAPNKGTCSGTASALELVH